MVSVTLRFLATLFGSLAAFFIASHLAQAGGYISAYTLSRVDEFYRLLLQPLTTMEETQQKTLMIVAGGLIVQGLIIYGMFRRWDRPPTSKPIAVEYSDREIPERLRSDFHAELRDDRDMSFETPMELDGPSARAIEAARRLAITR